MSNEIKEEDDAANANGIKWCDVNADGIKEVDDDDYDDDDVEESEEFVSVHATNTNSSNGTFQHIINGMIILNCVISFCTLVIMTEKFY